jgi:hypothetical protein
MGSSVSSGTYDGPDRRSKTEASLENVQAAIGRVASHLESETRFRDWVHEKFHDIKDTLFGNGKKGLVREMDQVQGDILRLKEDFAEMKGLIKTVIGWALASSISALGLILFEVVMLFLRRGTP